MSEKKTETKTAKAKAKTTKQAEVKPKREKPPKEDLCVFALRMTEPERTKLHQMAGPAQATRVMRALALAFSHEDEGAFKSILLEAKKLRAQTLSIASPRPARRLAGRCLSGIGGECF